MCGRPPPPFPHRGQWEQIVFITSRNVVLTGRRRAHTGSLHLHRCIQHNPCCSFTSHPLFFSLFWITPLSGSFVHGTSVLDGHLKFFSILLDFWWLFLVCRRSHLSELQTWWKRGLWGSPTRNRQAALTLFFFFFPHLCGHRLYLVIVVAGMGSSVFLLRRVVA